MFGTGSSVLNDRAVIIRVVVNQAGIDVQAFDRVGVEFDFSALADHVRHVPGDEVEAVKAFSW